MKAFAFSSGPLDTAALRAAVQDPRCGGFAVFEGWVRNHNEGHAVTRLEYEAFIELAEKEGARIVEEARNRFGVTQASCVHRLGSLALGDVAVWVGVSAAHRDEAFRACRYIIDEVKHRVPIWKKEHYVSGDSGWVNCERCATTAREAHHRDQPHAHAHDHEHEHTHAHQHLPQQVEAAAPAHAQGILVPDYSRQTALREVGESGQQRLRAASVLIVGAGGLGVPVLQYLAGAGVGRLTIVDGDRLEPSNLHRQTWYTLADCGQPKAPLAATRVRALNPEVHVVAHAVRLDRHNGAQLAAGHDLMLDCSDNFSTKFLLNDLALQLKIPALFASVYQYEGQLQLVGGDEDSACLRCVWPDATRDGLVGNCAEAGVLGPVPGVFGSLQALEALKLLLGLEGLRTDEMLIFDLVTLQAQRLRARRDERCQAHASAQDGATADASRRTPAAAAAPTEGSLPLEASYDDLAQAVREGYVLVDVRESRERDVEPLPASSIHLPMQQLLAGASRLDLEGHYLLVCATGKRSAAAADLLRSQGIRDCRSLKGGMRGLRTSA